MLHLLFFLGTAFAQTSPNDVQAAVAILRDLPINLSENFCLDFTNGNGGGVVTSTETLPCSTDYPGPTETEGPWITSDVTDYPLPTTTPWIITVTSTFTTTYYTTSTIYVPWAPEEPTSYYSDIDIPMPTFYDDLPEPTLYPRALNKRQNWCSDYGVPCRLAQYPKSTIASACAQFLAPSYGDAVATVTVTVPAEGCEETGYPDDSYPGDVEPYPFPIEPTPVPLPSPIDVTYPGATTTEGNWWDALPTAGDGEDLPDWYENGAGSGYDGEDLPEYGGAPVADGEDLPDWYAGAPVADGEGLPEWDAGAAPVADGEDAPLTQEEWEQIYGQIQGQGN